MLRGFLFGIISIVCLFISTNNCLAQEIVVPNIDTELDCAVADLERLPLPEQEYALYITSYNLPDDLKIKAYNILNITVHSLSYGRSIAKPVIISPTLFRLNINDYEWSDKAVETVSKFDPYFRVPWIDYTKYGKLRFRAGNRILRLDWFVANTLDVSKQQDKDIKDIFYFTLLYSKAPFGIPKNLDEYRKTWGVDGKKIEDLGLPVGGIVSDGHSPVARFNRQLGYSRIETGYHWESSDYKNNQGKRDIVENLEPGVLHRKADAHEIITTNFVGAQVYFLTDGEEKSVNIGNTDLVRDLVEPSNKDVRVKMVRSCIKCHNILGNGIINFNDTIREKINNGVKLNINIYSQKDYKRFYLSDELGNAIEDSNRFYLRAINSILSTKNNLDTSDAVGKGLETFIQNYEGDITLKIAARECGVTEKQFLLKVGPTVRGRLASLITTGESIPRDVWEDTAFAEAMLLIKEINPNEIIAPIKQNKYVYTINEQTIVVDAKDKKKKIVTINGIGARLTVKQLNRQTVTIIFTGSSGKTYVGNVSRNDIVFK